MQKKYIENKQQNSWNLINRMKYSIQRTYSVKKIVCVSPSYSTSLNTPT